MAPATRKTAALVLAGCTALALSAATGARGLSFSGKAGSGCNLTVYKREKK